MQFPGNKSHPGASVAVGMWSFPRVCPLEGQGMRGHNSNRELWDYPRAPPMLLPGTGHPTAPNPVCRNSLGFQPLEKTDIESAFIILLGMLKGEELGLKYFKSM